LRQRICFGEVRGGTAAGERDANERDEHLAILTDEGRTPARLGRQAKENAENRGQGIRGELSAAAEGAACRRGVEGQEERDEQEMPERFSETRQRVACRDDVECERCGERRRFEHGQGEGECRERERCGRGGRIERRKEVLCNVW
jgi:hypothetical protein